MLKQRKNQTKPSQVSLTPKQEIQRILDIGNIKEVRSLFAFTKDDSIDLVLLKFNIWTRWFFPQFFGSPDAPFHKEIDMYNLLCYVGKQKFFVDIAFRGAAKTTRTKLIVAFCIANDVDHFRRYIKVLSADRSNAVQIVTDVYNLLINQRIIIYYPEIFQKTVEKRQETMSAFMTSTGVKMQADSVGTDQRGDIQDDSRPDFLWFDDFETQKTLRSAVISNAIADNMDEAKQGMSKNGSALYNCNYLSERGNVHQLVLSKGEDTHVSIVPIKGSIENGVFIDGKPTWEAAYTPSEVASIIKNAKYPSGDYLCVPSAGPDIYFDRVCVNKQEIKIPVREIAGFKIYHKYDPSHRYASGHDVAKGIELDASTSVFIDFSTIPNRVVATYVNNEIEPTVFGDEIFNEGEHFGQPLCAVENNKFEDCIARLRHLGHKNLYFTQENSKPLKAGSPATTRVTYGWNTNTTSKSSMLGDLKQAIENGTLELSDPALISEARSYSRDDLLDKPDDVRLTTRHFDLLMAAAIAFKMRDKAIVKKQKEHYQQGAYESPGLE